MGRKRKPREDIDDGIPYEEYLRQEELKTINDLQINGTKLSKVPMYLTDTSKRFYPDQNFRFLKLDSKRIALELPSELVVAMLHKEIIPVHSKNTELELTRNNRYLGTFYLEKIIYETTRYYYIHLVLIPIGSYDIDFSVEAMAKLP